MSDSTGIPTAWMWANERTGGVAGVTLDVGRRLLQWYDEPGCACGDSSALQPAADFLQRGPRGGSPPPDVIAEMRAALARLD